MNTFAFPGAGIADSVGARWRIALALVMRQMKVRAGEDKFGYIGEILEPVLIISLLSLAMTFRHDAVPPAGDSYPLFIATGYLPFKAFLFISNDMRKTLGRTSDLLSLPVVQQTDAMVASLLLKSLTTMIVMVVVVLLMNACGYTVVPDDPLELLHAFFWIVVFSFGFGLISSTLMELIPGYKIVHKVITFKLLIVSGVFFLPEMMPPEVRYYLAFNPILHAVAWFRSAFIAGFHSSVLDIGYLVWWSVLMILSGLLLNRVFRARLSDSE